MEVKIRNERIKTKTNKRELLYGTCIQIVKYKTIRLACTVSALSLNTGATIVLSPNIDFAIKCLSQKKKFTTLV